MAISVRLEKPSLVKMLRTCVSTVRSDRNSRWAISRFANASATKWAISASRGVRRASAEPGDRWPASLLAADRGPGMSSWTNSSLACCSGVAICRVVPALVRRRASASLSRLRATYGRAPIRAFMATASV